MIKSGKYSLKSKLGFLDGLKNGYISIFGSILNLFESPFKIGFMIYNGNISSIGMYLLYLLISTFTCFFTLVTIKFSILYDLGFFIGISIAISLIKESN